MRVHLGFAPSFGLRLLKSRQDRHGEHLSRSLQPDGSVRSTFGSASGATGMGDEGKKNVMMRLSHPGNANMKHVGYSLMF